MAPIILKIDQILAQAWCKIPCPRSELCLDIVLNCGQSFRWRRLTQNKQLPSIWVSVLEDQVWLLSQNDTEILYKTYSQQQDQKDHFQNKNRLRDYFQLDLCKLNDLYPKWRKVDQYFDSCCDKMTGVRTLRQHPVENLFSFICSSNNNIARISSMVENLCSNFGDDCGVRIDEGEKELTFFSFPPVDRLAEEGVEEKLRGLGFGYRAKFIQKSARSIVDKGGEKWLVGLRDLDYEESKSELTKLCGVGEKVADCVCLMSLDKHGTVPVDTHVLQIAQKYLAVESAKTKKLSPEAVQLKHHMGSTKTMTARLYRAVADYFQAVWGKEFAGWAQSVVFAADLKTFSMPDKVKPNADCVKSTKRKSKSLPESKRRK